jgi:hypothetical protein
VNAASIMKKHAVHEILMKSFISLPPVIAEDIETIPEEVSLVNLKQLNKREEPREP